VASEVQLVARKLTAILSRHSEFRLLQKRQKAAAVSAAALAKIQQVTDRDNEARETRFMARAEADTRMVRSRTVAAFLCGHDLDTGTDIHSRQGVSRIGTAAPKILDADVMAVTTGIAHPITTTRKRAARTDCEAQRANVDKQNKRRGAILKAKTAARKRDTLAQVGDGGL